MSCSKAVSLAVSSHPLPKGFWLEALGPLLPRPLHRAAWVSSRYDNWLPPESCIHERTGEPPMEAAIFYNQIWESTSHDFCHILLVTWDSRGNSAGRTWIPGRWNQWGPSVKLAITTEESSRGLEGDCISSSGSSQGAGRVLLLDVVVREVAHLIRIW